MKLKEQGLPPKGLFYNSFYEIYNLIELVSAFDTEVIYTAKRQKNIEQILTFNLFTGRSVKIAQIVSFTINTFFLCTTDRTRITYSVGSLN